MGTALSTLGKGLTPALFDKARQLGMQLPDELTNQGTDLRPSLVVSALRRVAGHFFPLLTADADNHV